jgi:hypothetical protein
LSIRLIQKELLKMRHVKLLGLCIVALLATCSIAVAEASATPEHIYKINGSKLEIGETREIKASAKAEFTLKGFVETPVGKIAWILSCKKLKLDSAKKPVIFGGTPGGSERESIEFEECKATVGGASCTSVLVVPVVPANNELVTIVKPASKSGKIATLFVPSFGKSFWEIEFFKCGIFGTQLAKVEKATAAWVNPEAVEEVKETLVWNEEITEVETQSKEKLTVGLKASGNLATINGEASVELVFGQNWGAF